MKFISRHFCAGMMILLVVLSFAQQAQALVVFDPNNYSQNLLTAARTLLQINNQVTHLQTQALMLVNQVKNLTNLPTSVASDLRNSLANIDQLVRSARNVSYQVDAIDAYYQRLYPQQYATATSSSQIFQDGQEAWNAAREGFQHSMRVQATVVEQVRIDGSTLDRLISQSQGAVGSLQAVQAGNQLVALNAKQTMQLQTLLAASSRADALDRTATLAAREQGRKRLQNFLGDGSPYTR